MIRLKPPAIARIDRAEVARTGTLWATFAQDDGVIRDIVRGLPGSTDLAMLASRIVSDEGTALSFNGTTNGSAGIVGTLPPIENLAFIARVRSTGAQPGNPGAAFGIYASTAQGGLGIGFNGNNVGAAWLTSAGAGTAATVPTVQGQWYTVIVQGTPANPALTAVATWVDGAPAVRGGTSNGAVNGPLNEVVVGAQHASSGYLRRFRGDVLWAAILVGDSPNWMTDEIAASLYASDYPYNLISKSRTVWPVAAGGVHAASGALLGGSAAISGSAARSGAHASTGALVSGSSTIAGSAVRTHLHSAAGALASGAATVAGSSVRAAGRVAAGALAAASAAIAGAATRFRAHASSGVLASGSAEVAGAADLIVPGGTHAASGALASGAAAVAGAALLRKTHAAVGALASDAATITGLALRGGEPEPTIIPTPPRVYFNWWRGAASRQSH